MQELVADAAVAGWTYAETFTAITEVCDNLVLGLGENFDVETLLAQFRPERDG